MCVVGWSLNKGSVIGLDNTPGQKVYGVWLVGSCQNTIYQTKDSETAKEIIFKREKALTIFHLMQGQIWSLWSSGAASHVLGTQYKNKVMQEQTEYGFGPLH